MDKGEAARILLKQQAEINSIANQLLSIVRRVDVDGMDELLAIAASDLLDSTDQIARVTDRLISREGLSDNG